MARDALGLFGIHNQLRVARVVSQDRSTTAVETSHAAGFDLVPGSLRHKLSFELGEGQQHVEHEPAHRSRCVDLLRDRNERDVMLGEQFHQTAEVQQRP